MEERLKQRLVGAIVLVSLAVVFVPILLDAPREVNEEISAISVSEIPERPQEPLGSPASNALAAPETPRLDAEVERERDRHASGTDAAAPRVSSPEPASAPTSTSSQGFGSDSASPPSEAPASTSVPGVSTRSGSSPAGSESAITGSTPDDAPGNKWTAAAPAAVAGGWVVQLGSFLKSENAFALRRRLQAAGYPAYVQSGISAQGQVSRVFVGPMPERVQAKDSAAKLRREMALEGIVVPYPDR